MQEMFRNCNAKSHEILLRSKQRTPLSSTGSLCTWPVLFMQISWRVYVEQLKQQGWRHAKAETFSANSILSLLRADLRAVCETDMQRQSYSTRISLRHDERTLFIQMQFDQENDKIQQEKNVKCIPTRLKEAQQSKICKEYNILIDSFNGLNRKARQQSKPWITYSITCRRRVWVLKPIHS